MYSVNTRTPAEFLPASSGRNVRCSSRAANMSCSSQDEPDAWARTRVAGRMRPSPLPARQTPPGRRCERASVRPALHDDEAFQRLAREHGRRHRRAPIAASPGRSVGVTGMSPRAAIGPHTAFSDASRPAPARESRTPRKGRPFSGRNRSASETSDQSIATATASRCASSDGDAGSPRQRALARSECDPRRDHRSSRSRTITTGVPPRSRPKPFSFRSSPRNLLYSSSK